MLFAKDVREWDEADQMGQNDFRDGAEAKSEASTAYCVATVRAPCWPGKFAPPFCTAQPARFVQLAEHGHVIKKQESARKPIICKLGS